MNHRSMIAGTAAK